MSTLERTDIERVETASDLIGAIVKALAGAGRDQVGVIDVTVDGAPLARAALIRYHDSERDPPVTSWELRLFSGAQS